MLSNSIPNGTKLTLRVLDAKKGALKKRRTHPGGEQGGDPQSIRFLDRVGVDYVSCSPFRVPVARLAAAHAALVTE